MNESAKADEIAVAAQQPTRTRPEKAARVCEALEKCGLSERGGTQVLARWRRAG